MKELLFRLNDGSAVYSGDVLYHPNYDQCGWCVIAEFPTYDFLTVTVRTQNGAVPTVNIKELLREPEKIKRCILCKQPLP